ncbi:hypothetical protein SCUCBS95973_005327 [Sporothrix curviconia]|uniref:FAD/NAD(P)-binding domain-containing protein n=1 Tax=Sporothrix curviconia TaxID=1260050 RepID=A0ABP0BWX6_9PEZI
MASSTGPDHTVVILGAGYAGVPMAHHLLKRTPANVANVRVILVAPNDALFFNTAAPRGLLPVDDTKNSSSNPKGTPGYGDDRLFYDLAPAFAKYNAGGAKRFEQVVGRATSLDPDRQTVEVKLLAGGEAKTVHYDTVLIATGSDMTDGSPFKVVSYGGTAETKAALAAYRAQVKTAAHIVVAGGGLTGVEVAGELGSVYGSKVVGGAAPAAPKSEQKEILFVINEPLPLGVYGAKESVRQTAADRLAALGVRIVANTTVTAAAAASAPGGNNPQRTVLTLTDKAGKTSTLETDVYIPALGSTVNTGFLPERLLDTSAKGKRRVRARTTLQAEGYDNIFVIGDALDLIGPSLKNVTEQLEVLAPNMQAYLKNWAASQSGAKSGSAAAAAPLKEYAVSNMIVLAASTGPAGGTGQMGSMKLPSLLVWFFKARYLGTDKAQEYADGSRTAQNSKW